MFINDDLVFIQLQKMACTHITRLIDARWPGKVILDEVAGKHQALTESPGGRKVIASIRNPYSWYVSLWAYGCEGKGTLAWTLTASPAQVARTQAKQVLQRRQSPGRAMASIAGHARKDTAFWRRVYSDAGNVEHFRDWLSAIHAPQGTGLLTEGYADHDLRNAVGFYTYRFLCLVTRYEAWLARSHALKTYDDVRRFSEAEGIVDHFIRTEHINADLGRAMSDILGTDVHFEEQGKRTNQSKHRQTSEYYDTATRQLVRDRDRLIFENFYPEEA